MRRILSRQCRPFLVIILISSVRCAPPSATPGQPGISQLEPAAGPIGTTVTITGSDFLATGNSVKFGPDSALRRPDGSPVNIVVVADSADGVTLTFDVPAALLTGIVCDEANHCAGVSSAKVGPGLYPVSVFNTNGTSNVVLFNVTE